MLIQFDKKYEYAVVGAGPAGICAVAKIYASGVPGDQILWIDPQFQVGDFGTKLSEGSSVPGNTSVASYLKVNNAIYSRVPICTPTAKEKAMFALLSLASNTTCPIKIASQPLQHITDNLRTVVHSIKGTTPEIEETKQGLQLTFQTTDGRSGHLIARRVILAIGAEPKTMQLPVDQITKIDPVVSFIESELRRYIANNSSITQVAVIGSSHSAALAVMNLLQNGVAVKQFMNKEYRFAIPVTDSNGIRYTQFDNTGLKGNVAVFTRKLLSDKKAGTGEYADMWECYINNNVEAILSAHLSSCTHAVISIGYKVRSSLKVNGNPLSAFHHDKRTTEIMDTDGRCLAGLFGAGIAFPTEVKAISGEVESAVGVEKFWNCMNESVLKKWRTVP